MNSFIENALLCAIYMSVQAHTGKTVNIEDVHKNFFKKDNEKLNAIYFAGQTLFLDTPENSITLSWDKETYGFFKGDTPRQLLNLRNLQLLKELMELNNIKFQPKEHI